MSEPGPSALDLLPVPDWVGRRAETHPDHPALEVGEVCLSYRELDGRVAAAAAWLSERGARGSVVALLARAGLDFAQLSWAVPRSGAVLLPLNTRLSTAEIVYQLTDSRATLLLTDHDHHEQGRAAAAMTGTTAWETGQASSAAGQVVGRGPAGDNRQVPREAIHSLIYTSGTTGRPKGVLLSHGNFYWSAVASGQNLGVAPHDRWLACMPLFHVGGLSILLRSAIYGGTAVIHDRFDAAAVNRAIREEGVTLLSVVATMLARMLDRDERSFPSALRAVLVGGGPVPPGLLERARARGLPVLQTYGPDGDRLTGRDAERAGCATQGRICRAAPARDDGPDR